MKSEDVMKELWSLANVIAGFSVAQNMAFAFALSKDMADLQSQIMIVKIVLTIFSAVFSAIYTFGIWRCHALAMRLDKTHATVWRQVTQGRVFCIWLFMTIPIFGLYAPDIFNP